MNLLDLFLLAAVVVFAYAGFRRGFIVGALGFAGFVGGGALGMVLVPVLVGSRTLTVATAGIALASVLACASLGQVLASWGGSHLRARLSWQPARQVDAALGALLSVVAMLLVAWFLALAVVQGPFPGLTRQVRDSKILGAVNTVMPEGSQEWFSNFRTAVDSSVFPQVFGGLPGRPVPVDSPDAAILRDPDVIAAKKSIVEIDGLASSCNEQITGTGFVVADDRVVTNAHVVAGVTDPRVSVGGLGFGRRATVVYFDSLTDLAVLAVPGLDAPALRLHQDPLSRGDDAVVAGFPEGGPYTTVPARVRERQQARGRDIYDSASVTREVYSLRAQIRPGNSGGPLLLDDGSVAGVVFAAAVGDDDTGYALTENEVDDGIRAGVAATSEVDTGRCA